jgi:hypothetical protein
VSVTKVLAVAIGDTPGSLGKVLRLLADAAISVEYTYAFIARTNGLAYVVFRVADNDQAQAVLAQNGVKLAQENEVYDL